MSHADDGSKALIGIRSGSVEAFDRFYETHASFVYTIALKMTKDPTEAEDLCHDIFVEVFRHPEQFDSSRGSVKAWLAVKTKSRFIDRVRKKKRVVVGHEPAETVEGQPSTEDIVLQKLERDNILAVLDHLPDSQKDAVYKKYFEYQTQEEIANVMQRPIGTIKSLIRYGLKNLQKQMTKSGWAGIGGDQRDHKM